MSRRKDLSKLNIIDVESTCWEKQGMEAGDAKGGFKWSGKDRAIMLVSLSQT